MTQPLAVDRYVVETLMRDMVGHDRNPSGYLVFLWLWAATDGGRRRHAASLQTIARGTGLSKSSVQNAVRYLNNRRRLIDAEREGPTTPPLYSVHAPWRPTSPVAAATAGGGPPAEAGESQP